MTKLKEPDIDMDKIVTDEEHEKWKRYLASKYGRSKDDQLINISKEYCEKRQKAKKYKDPLNKFEEDGSTRNN